MRMRCLTNHVRVVIAIATGLIAAGQLAGAQAPRTRDSAGVRIVENPPRKSAPVVFRLGDKPLFEVGGVESNPDEEFDHQGNIRGAPLANGGLAVIDVSRVHYFDSKGKRVRIVGREGQGPEEFMRLIAVCRTRGDTLLVSDSRNHRLSVLDENGRIVRTILRGDNGSAPPSFCLDDGTFVLERRIGDVAGGDRHYRITRLRTDGSVVGVVGTFEGRGLDITMVGMSINGARNAVYVGEPFSGEIRVYDPSGRLQRIIRTSDAVERITEAEAEARMASSIPRNVTGAARTKRMDRMRALPHSPTWPVFYGLEVGTDGTIWVKDYRKGRASPDGWTAFDSTGRIVGRLVLPPPPERTIGPEVQGFGSDRVLLRRFDADGATHLMIYPILRTPGRTP